MSHHPHTICKGEELMAKTYRNGLFLKKSYKSPKIRISEKIRTKKDLKKKSVFVRTNLYEWEHCLQTGEIK